MLYHPVGEHAGAAETYARDYQQASPQNKIELTSVDRREGADLAALYGINEYPALLVLAQDGSLLRLWQGNSLPLMSELSAYATS